MKRFQNKVAESRYALPLMAMYALGIWLLGGLVEGQWYPQFAMLMLSTYLMVELNNTNALLHMYSRMVSCTFLALTSMAVFLFPSVKVVICMLSVIMFCTLIFHTYQDKKAVGLTYYAFLLFGVASIAYVHVLFFLPLIWLLMITNIMSMSWRTWVASLLGLVTPYWFGSIWLLYQKSYTLAIEHFSALTVFEEPFNLYGITDSQKATLALVILLAIIGAIHFIHKNFLDKIRIRMYYGFFMWMDLAALVFLLLQPQHFNAMLLIMIVNTSPLIAHFVALTSTKITNIAFLVLSAITFLLTVYNIWITSSLFS